MLQNGGRDSSWNGPPRISIGDVSGTNPLWDYYQRYDRGPVIDKWHQYFDVYHR